MNLAIVSAYPGDRATAELSARLLAGAASRLGWEVSVELDDPQHPERRLSAEALARADWVLLIGQGETGRERFAGKRVYQASPQEALENPGAFLQRAEREAELSAAALGTATPAEGGQAPRVVAVTACPTGVAHTFMAAEALKQAAQKLGYGLKVETQGSVGARDPLSAQDIADADVVLLATDIEVDTVRFAGKRVYHCGTGQALKQGEATLKRALAEAQTMGAAPAAGAGGAEGKAAKAGKGESAGVYKHLLTGVSYMLPMVVAGGLLIALSFVFGIEAFREEGTLAAALMTIGGETAFQLMVPLLAGYIAYSIADRPGLAPGMIGGMLASTLGAGFIGGIVAGFIAGYSARAISRHLKLPQSLEALKPILIIPLVASLVTGLLMIYVVGKPVAGVLEGLTRFLDTMGTSNAVLLGLLLGAMMCVDLGGPVNKAAYAFSVGLLASQSYAPMAATMAAGMVPPIGLGIATLLARHKFAKAERDAGKAALVLGACFISEGAIPFAARDPLRVIPASIVGGALTGALSMYFGCRLMAPHGGVFVLLIPNAINHALLYLLAIVAGSVVTGVLYAALARRDQPAMVVEEGVEGAR
ncbi:PTS fructose transporter subunit IIBC [Verticiella sediminum]|uniref:protein-N(pi)-phosphohistidine--D-fructose phosphotransferase n=1 Tax=Verticiella sediminum TaxID=1247510 RepID=A0A556AG84_9BURK|nr:fructose-specific PTS transporter subunit EIIC [Verticiella sediminum]TSH91910.1 PTS fructose transporter subunit IIBC [Verticiella sediminum]